jgi:transcriptional regulator of acetoin/glycerol metabolism
VLERAQILAEGSLITTDDLPDNLLLGPLPGEAEEGETQDLHQIQRRHVQAVLHEAKGNKVHAARALGISRRALYRLLEKYQIKTPESS